MIVSWTGILRDGTAAFVISAVIIALFTGIKTLIKKSGKAENQHDDKQKADRYRQRK